MSCIQELRASEQANKLSSNMDSLSFDELSELFLMSNQHLILAFQSEKVKESINSLVQALSSDNISRLVIGGAGTSGRFAHILETFYADALQEKAGIELVPWIAGGEEAIVKTVEGAEDDTLRAIKELGPILTSKTHFSGVSCGLSAPCIAISLELAEKACGSYSVFGVNELSSAREDEILDDFIGIYRRRNKDFRSILEVSSESNKFTSLTPLVGPELLTGSSRLKGGSATFLIYKIAFEALITNKSVIEIITSEIENLENMRFTSKLPKVMEEMANCIERGGRVFYQGNGDFYRASVLDASECPPTFGASHETVTAVISYDNCLPDFLTFDYHQDADYLNQEQTRIKVREKDIVIYVGNQECNVPTGALFIDVIDFFHAKLTLNALSTGAFAKAGYVFGNKMINVQISNSKLFDRAKGLIREIVGMESNILNLNPKDDLAEAYLRKALLKKDVLNSEDWAIQGDDLYALTRSGIVAEACLIGKGRTVVEAQQELSLSSSLRDIFDREKD